MDLETHKKAIILQKFIWNKCEDMV